MNGHGFNPMYPDPWAMIFANTVAQKPKKKTSMKREMQDFFEAMEAFKKATGGDKKEEKKPDPDKWTTGDYFIVYSFIFLGGGLTSVYLILTELIKFAEIMHK